MLINLIDLWPHRFSLFSNEGLLPTLVPAQSALRWSLFSLGNTPSEVTALLLLAFLACLGLIVGILPRIMVVILWVWHVSYSHWLGATLEGFDSLLRNGCFLLMLAPAFGPPRRTAPRYSLVLLRWQVCLMYWGSFYLKIQDRSWREGIVVDYFLKSNYSRLRLLDFGSLPPGFLSGLCYAVLALELLLPFMLLLPRYRKAGIGLGVAFHLVIGVISNIGVFSAVMILHYALFLQRSPSSSSIGAGTRRRDLSCVRF